MEELQHIIFLFYLACDLYTPGGFSARPVHGHSGAGSYSFRRLRAAFRSASAAPLFAAHLTKVF